MKKYDAIEQLYQQYRKALTSSQAHDVKMMLDESAKLAQRKETLDAEFENLLADFQKEITEYQELYQNEEEYYEKLLTELDGKNIRIEKDENGLLIGPISFRLDTQKMVAEIQFGRKKQTISKLKPNLMADFIVKYYEQLNRSFKLDRFVKQLVLAYEYVNRTRLGGKEVNYGMAVSINDIYSLFNISPVNHGYKKENFLWDLGQLISQLEDVKKYRIELGYSRQVGNMFLIYDVHNHEHKVSSLTVYNSEE
jgi:hypothetical protein